MSASRLIKIGFTFAVLMVAKSGWSSGLSDVEILDRSAEQRTLVVSAAKNYVLAASGIDVKESEAAKKKAIRQFENNLKVLKLNANSTYTRSNLKAISQDWGYYRALINQKATPSNVEAVIEATNKLIFLSDAVTNNWSGMGSNPELEALNLAHLQAMLSERIGLLYAAHYYGLKTDWVVMELNETLHEYERRLDFFERFVADENKVALHLEQVNNQWIYAKQGLAKFNQGHYLPKVIAVTMNSMREQMVHVASYYSRTNPVNPGSFSTLSVPGLAANIE